MESARERDPMEELGRRLHAAYASWHLGSAGVDRTLRQHRQRRIAATWLVLARVLHDGAQRVLEETLKDVVREQPGLRLVK